MKKRKILLCSIFLMGVFFQPVSVLAGDINGNEQGVLDYVSGAVFEYEGTSYVAKEVYINQLRTKFMEDGVDLTQKEANNAIMQISVNVKTGVTDGYLQPISSSGEIEPSGTPAGESGGAEPTVNSPNETENSKGEINNTGEGESESLDGDLGEAEDGTPNKNEVELPGKSGSEKTGERDSKGNSKEQKDNPNISVNKLPKDSKTQKTEEEKKNVENFIQEVLSQDAETVNISVEEGSKDSSSIVAVEEYLSGEMTIVSMDGEILLHGNLPIKNTGYQTKEKAIILGAIFYCGVLFVLLNKKRMCGNKDEA